MKLFTPDLMARYGSDDPALWEPADAEWEDRAERYRAYLDSIKATLPPGLRHILDSYYLHDAVVRGLGQRERSFVIVLQLDTPPHSLLTFTYELLDDPAIDKEALPQDLRSTGDHVDWQYDEIEQIAAAPPSWRQSILFSNGWEVQLHFRDVRVEEAHALIPVPHTDHMAAQFPTAPQSA